jgi:hypothetical protein
MKKIRGGQTCRQQGDLIIFLKKLRGHRQEGDFIILPTKIRGDTQPEGTA